MSEKFYKASTIFIILLFLVLTGCAGDEEQSEDIVTKWSLWSTGTQLRGINIWQKKIDPEVDGDFLGTGKFGPPFKKEDFEKLRSLGANYVNISHPGIYTVDQPYIADPDALNNLKSLISLIGESDMFAVISFRTGPGRSEYTFYFGEDFQSDPENGWFDPKYYNEKVWKDENAKRGWVNMWKKTAEEFNDNPYVVGYDLMVEPNPSEVILGISEPDEFYPEYRGSSYDWNSFFPDLISGIRESDINTPIIVGAMFYSNLDWLPYLQIVSDTKTIYSFHQYSPYSYSHQERYSNINYPGKLDLNWDFIPDDFNKQWLTGFLNIADKFIKENGVIVTANEFGCVRWAGNAKGFLDDEMEIFESFGINYAIWAWSSGSEPYRSEVDAFDYLMGINPDNRKDIEDNELITVLKKYWSKNSSRPSNTRF
ncbi:MAG: cellulase family glycosylhydrolase [Acidobacteriota bacterium]